jgi:nucleoside-diphosphate-sugar epimerase
VAQEQCRILTVGRDQLDLRDQPAVDRWFDEHRPEAVLLAARRVGGIHDNDTHPGDFLYDNLTIATNVIDASRRTGVAKLLFLIGTGTDVTIAELAQLIADVVGFTGRFAFDASMPDGTPRKLLDVSKLTALGWRPQINFKAGIRQTYDWYRTSRAARH